MMEALLGLQDWWIFPLQVQGHRWWRRRTNLALRWWVFWIFFGEFMIRSNYRKVGKGGAWFVKMDLVWFLEGQGWFLVEEAKGDDRMSSNMKLIGIGWLLFGYDADWIGKAMVCLAWIVGEWFEWCKPKRPWARKKGLLVSWILV